MPAQPSGIRCFTYSSFEHTNNAGPEGHPADRSVNSDQNAHLNQQSRRPRRNRAANPSEPSRAIKAQPHPALPGQPKTYGSRLRDRADRSWSSAGSGVPAVGDPGLGEEPSGDDDGVGQCDECLDHPSAALGAEGEFAKAAVVPGVGPLDHPAAARLEWEALGADQTGAAELIEQVAGLGRVVASTKWTVMSSGRPMLMP